MNKIALRTAIASAVIAPVMFVGAGAGTATAAPILSAGGAGEISIKVPDKESWNCFALDSNFGLKAGVGTVGGFTRGSNVTVFCFGTTAPFFFTGSVKAGT
ncbi:hypothetical protein Rhow_001691 [Rhodococcus wratislaviensis]|uniref:Secreted protein n=1 Tax=Rhodococcus wratislaviensis TaxID=44752 RepID=A0A402BY71_RHOWR|nr:hypothetical protein [Rhodococcus wratislaviensis]GCE36325.1 hypothetical protein Rhow_001691 [Rhodococcus wratislaviensis]